MVWRGPDNRKVPLWVVHACVLYKYILWYTICVQLTLSFDVYFLT